MEDRHLGTGEYEPEKYWDARATQAGEDDFQAVCAFGATRIENRCMDRVQRCVMRSVLSRLDLNGKDVLEFGCGVGRWLPLLAEYDCRWHGVDVSDAMLQRGKEHHPEAEFRKVEGLRIPYPGDRFDLVYTVTVLHHNPYDVQREIVRELLRVSKSGAYIVLYEDVAARQTSFNMFPRTVSSWIRLVEDLGARSVHVRCSRFWILKNLGKKVSRRIRRLAGYSVGEAAPRGISGLFPVSLWQSISGPIDLLIDPFLQPLLPRSFCSGAVIAFEKDGDQCAANTHVGQPKEPYGGDG